MVFDKIFERNLARTVSLALAVFILQVLFLDFFPKAEGYTGWLVFGLLISKMIGIGHPPAPDNRVLDTKRKVLGWLTLLIFLLCFSPKPFIVM
jgi:hypothetical protein